VPEAAERCPSCGAALREAPDSGEEDIPGVTQVDPVVAMRRQLPRPNRLVGWLADVDTEPTSPIDLVARSTSTGGAGSEIEGADAASVAPPSDEVRREIRRLELEALKAQLEQRAADARLAAMDAGQAPPATPSPDALPSDVPVDASLPDAPPPDAEAASRG
jgi:hypothetical protein